MSRRLTAVALTATAVLLGGCTSEATSGAPAARSTVPNLVPDDQVAATDAPRPTATDVVLSFAGWDEATASVQAGGYVSPVVEDGGTCTLELTLGDRTTRITKAGTADATTTVCGGLSAARDTLGAGTWKVVLRYQSPTASGTSQPLTVQVPA